MLKYFVIGVLVLQVPNAQPTKNKSSQNSPSAAQATPVSSNEHQTEMANKPASASNERDQNQNWVAVITSIVTATAILIYTVFAVLQWWAIRKQAEHTASQAATMQGQLDAMKDQARLMQDSLTETRNLVAQNKRAVQAAEQSIEAARANLIDEQRAHVRVTGGDAPGNAFRLQIGNTGKTPAAEVQIRAIAQVGYTPPAVPTPTNGLNNYTYIGVLPNGPGVREYEVRTAKRITDEEQKLLADPGEEFRLWCSGVIYYEDAFGEARKTGICLFRRGGNMQFEFWVTGNEAT